MRRREDGERGAAAVVTSIVMVVLLLMAAFAVDLGQQRVVRSDVQAIADVVALDVSRLLDGRKVSQYTDDELDMFEAAKNESVDRNTAALGGELSHSDVTWEFVKLVAGDWVAAQGNDVVEAVKVTASSTVGFAFGQLADPEGDGLGATRSAVASLEPFVCFSAGANLVDLHADDNVLVQALETFLGIDLLDLSASVVGPGGIASLPEVSVPLVDLAGALGVGTVDGLVNMSEPITVGELLTAMAEVLNTSGDLADADAALLLGALATRAALATPTLVISDILVVAPGGGSALNADVNVLDILNAVVFVAGEHAVGVTAPLNIDGVGALDASVTVIEIPKIACARPNQTPPVVAQSAQVRLTAHLDFPAGSSLVTNLLAGLNNTLSALLGELLSTRQEEIRNLRSGLAITVTSTSTTAKLHDPAGLRCSTPNGQQVTLDVTSSLADVDLALGTSYEVWRRTRALPLLPWGNWNKVTTVDDTILGLTAGVGDATPYEVTLTYPPPPSEEMPSHTRNTPLAVNLQLTLSDRNLITAIVGSLVDPIMDALVNPLLTALNADLMPALDSTFGLLGIEFGNATVKASGRPGCSPRLVG